MASLLASSRPSLLSPNPNPLRHPTPRRPPTTLPFPAASRYPRLSATPSDGPPPPPRRNPTGTPPDEWGEKSATEPEVPSVPDRPEDADEWGKEPGATAAAGGYVDEWGEKGEPEQEAPAEPDPPEDEDEWGGEPEETDYLPGNGSRPAAAAEEAVDDTIGDLKRCLVDTLYGTELGFRTSAEIRGEILELISQLEAENPTASPVESPELLDGNWILLYTAFSELLPLLAVGATPFFKIKKISQEIDSKTMTIVNATTLSSPFATFSFSATASFEVRSPSRIQVQFKEGAFQPPQISSTVDLPSSIDVFGQKVDLLPIQQSLNPVQEIVANIARTISGQPPLRVPIPGNRRGPPSWLLTTYLDEDFRISRGDGGLFVLAKETSPLLDQLS